MNRMGLGLAVGAGYLLGRTKKMKLAFAVGSMVAGKRMHLSPRALSDLVSQQLKNNPQFKEIGDQLREDLRGVGQAASGALVERQIEGIADRLHGRTAQVRDQLAGVVPDGPGGGEKEEEDEPDDEYQDEDSQEPDEEYEDSDEDSDEGEAEEPEAADERPQPRKKAPAKKAAQQRSSGKEAPAKKTAAKKKAPAKKTAAKKAPAKKTAAAKSAGRRATRPRQSAGGGDHD
ncbi:DNA primase [Streptomyces sp. NPDC048415]|uniref:DNA primase n=1 Tax=Streptomyces sp. NPDC048415 TaxID=3154822 RepID=UPI0034439D58